MRAGEVAQVTHTHTHSVLVAHTATEKSLSTSQRYITARCVERCLVFRIAARSPRAALQKSLFPSVDTQPASWKQVFSGKSLALKHRRTVDVWAFMFRDVNRTTLMFLSLEDGFTVRRHSLVPESPNFSKDGGVSLSVTGCQYPTLFHTAVTP